MRILEARCSTIYKQHQALLQKRGKLRSKVADWEASNLVQMGGHSSLILKFDIDTSIINTTLFLRMFLRLDERLRAD